MSIILSTREKTILDAIVSWSEPSDQNYRDEFREVLHSSDNVHFALKNLDLPGEQILYEIWKFIESLCDDSNGNAYVASEIINDPDDRYTAAWLLMHMAESSDPQEWFQTSFQDPVCGILIDVHGEEGYELQEQLESIVQPILDLSVFKKIIQKLIDLAENGPKNLAGLSFCQVLESASFLPKN